MKISVGQLRAARGLIGWAQADLAKAAKVGRATIADFESGKRDPYDRTLDVLQRTLESAGVIFVEENGEGPGVRLKKKPLAVAEITEKIEALNEKISAIRVEGEPSPEIGMNRLKKALVQNERTKLKNRRAKIKKSEAE
jgi:transcriptional regulator with XRE-family HTH domain